MDSLANRYNSVLERIDSAARQAGRQATDIELIVVTKNHPASLVRELIELGASHFGENRDQEAKPKAEEVAHASKLKIYDWHFVGQLQSNKVRSVMGYANTIHSLDRPSLLNELIKQATTAAKSVEVFIELNLTEDAGRGGIEPKDLRSFAEKVVQSSNLNLLGVMGVAGLDQEPEREFERIREASQLLQTAVPTAKYISAGMSGDFEAAILAGATHLRIGTAITGNRPV
ncbi:MAG: YggS family pyridoxal phosphate-dependent enzyme [Rhodoluna sp.]